MYFNKIENVTNTYISQLQWSQMYSIVHIQRFVELYIQILTNYWKYTAELQNKLTIKLLNLFSTYISQFILKQT